MKTKCIIKRTIEKTTRLLPTGWRFISPLILVAIFTMMPMLVARAQIDPTDVAATNTQASSAPATNAQESTPASSNASGLDISFGNGTTGGTTDLKTLRDTTISFRGIAQVLLLIALVVAAVAASWGNIQLSIYVGLGALIIFGGAWVFSIVSDTLGDSSAIPKAAEVQPGEDTQADYDDAARPIKAALNKGLTILTAVTLPFIMIYGLWLSLAVAAGEADGQAMRGYIMGAVVALSASIIAQLFKIF